MWHLRETWMVRAWSGQAGARMNRTEQRACWLFASEQAWLSWEPVQSVWQAWMRWEDAEATLCPSWKATKRTVHYIPRIIGPDKVLFVCLTFFLLLFWPRCAACRILVPRPGIEPRPRQWKRRVLTTGPPWNSQRVFNRGKTWSDMEEELRAYFTFYLKFLICNTFTCFQTPESMRRCSVKAPPLSLICLSPKQVSIFYSLLCVLPDFFYTHT